MLVSIHSAASAVTASSLVIPPNAPNIWGGSARGKAEGSRGGFMFAFSGEDGVTNEGSGFTTLLLPRQAATPLVFSFDLGDAQLDATFRSARLTAVTNDVVASAGGDVVTYPAWDTMIGEAAAVSLLKLTAAAGVAGPTVASSQCNFTGSWVSGSRQPYIVVEKDGGAPATFDARAEHPRSWTTARGSLSFDEASGRTAASIVFDNDKSDSGTFTPDCASVVWKSSGGGVWTRGGGPSPTPPTPAPPLPAGVKCTASGSFALCVAAPPSLRFAVVFDSSGGASADARARAAAACVSTTPTVSAVATARLSRLATLPPPPPRPASLLSFGDEMLSMKVYSTMRVNTLSAEGTAPVHWSTPDKTPHQAMWLWDSCFHAIGRAAAANARNKAAGSAGSTNIRAGKGAAGDADARLAWEFLFSMLSNAAPDGHVPIEASPWNGKLSGDTQPPLLALATAYVYEAGGVNASALAWAVPRLERYIAWDFENRDLDSDGLLEWHQGTESGLDNSVLFDHAVNKLASTDFSAYAALEMAYIAQFHALLGNATAAQVWEAKAKHTRDAIHAKLWDTQRNWYAYRALSNPPTLNGSLGEFDPAMTPSGFTPLLLDGVADARVVALIAHINDPTKFNAPAGLPTIALDNKEWCTNMWRGPAWINTNFFTVLGLRKYGHVPGALAAAEKLQTIAIDVVGSGYRTFGTTFEFYDSKNVTPPTKLARKSSPDSGGIRDYHWTAALSFWLLHNPNGSLPLLHERIRD